MTKYVVYSEEFDFWFESKDISLTADDIWDEYHRRTFTDPRVEDEFDTEEEAIAELGECFPFTEHERNRIRARVYFAVKEEWEGDDYIEGELIQFKAEAFDPPEAVEGESDDD